MDKKKIIELGKKYKKYLEPIIVGVVVLILIFLFKGVNIPKSIRYLMIFVGICLIVLGKHIIKKKKKG